MAEEANSEKASEPSHSELEPNIITSAANYPTVFSDGCLFATRIGSTVRLAFAETIIEPRDSPYPGSKTRHVSTVVMPVEVFAVTLRYLNSVKRTLLEGLPDGE